RKCNLPSGHLSFVNGSKIHCYFLKCKFMSSWKEIWNSRHPDRVSDLEDLIKLNGFDTNGTSFTADSWIKYVESFQKIIPIKPSDSVFEFGCGCGAFLTPLYDKGHEVGGIDYSEALISVAKINMVNAEFRLQNANESFGAKKYDIVMSHSVFQYFDSLEFARIVCRNMLEKSSRKVAILDIPNIQLQRESECARSLVQIGNAKRKGLDKVRHLYYEKRWFEQILENEKVDIEIVDQNVDGYINSNFRFNVIMTKP
ncbi:MAG: class I SAM-dependent methyltransferase, partial [Paracoccaceae bacterium]